MDHPGFVADRDARRAARSRRTSAAGSTSTTSAARRSASSTPDGAESRRRRHRGDEQHARPPDRAGPRRSSACAARRVATGLARHVRPGRRAACAARRFTRRGIDDQGGVAAALAMLDVLHKKPADVPVAVLLTRAEEDGFIGAVAAVLQPKLLRKSDRLIAIECSADAALRPAGQGRDHPRRRQDEHLQLRADVLPHPAGRGAGEARQDLPLPARPHARRDVRGDGLRRLRLHRRRRLRRAGQLPQHGPRARNASARSTSTSATGRA